MNLKESEKLVLSAFLEMVDIYGEPAISEELVLLAARNKRPVPRIFKWSEEDIAILHRDYPEKGSNIPELCKKFTTRQISNRAYELGLRKNTSANKSTWTDYQLRLLESKYPECGAEIPDLLCCFSRSQIIAQAYRRGISKAGTWTADEDNILKNSYPKYGSGIPELLIAHTKQAIIARARKLGIRYDRTRNAWTAKDIKIFKEKYPVYGVNITELKDRFDKEVIRVKATALHLTKNGRKPLKRFSSDEIALLKSEYHKYGTEIPELTANHDATAIRAKAHQLGLHYDANIFKRTQTLNNAF